MRKLALVALLGLVAGPAFGQTSTQCVSTAVAGGSANEITLPRLPCVPTTTLLVLKLIATNTSTTPTIQPQGMPAQVVKRGNGTAVQAGDLPANGYVMLTNNGSNWLLLTGGAGGAGPPGPPGQTGPAGPAATVTVGTVSTGAPGTPASVTNSGTPSNAVLNFTIPQGLSGGGGGGAAGGPGWTVVTPRGGGQDDTSNINNALSASTQGVLLTGGVFQVCNPIIVPRYKTLAGTGVPMYISGTSGQTPDPWPGNSVIHCSSTTNGFGTAASNPSGTGGAFVFLHDDTVVDGVAISGLNPITGGVNSNQVACINSISTQGVMVRNTVMANCYVGMRIRSDGNAPGDQGISLNQEFVVHDNTIWWTVDGLDIETVNGGQGTTDWRVYNNEIEVPTYAGIYTNPNASCIGFQISNNRIEDGNLGLSQGCNQGVISNNFFSNLNGGLMQFASATYGLMITGNSGLNVSGSSSPCFDILGQITGTSFQGNGCLYGYAGVFKVEPGGTAQNLLINDLPLGSQGGPPFFSGDTTLTDPTLRPWTMPFLVGGPNASSPWTP